MRILTVLLLIVLAPVRLMAWGFEGHVTVARIAYQRLNGETRSAVDRLLAAARVDLERDFSIADQRTQKFVESIPKINDFERASIWPDVTRTRMPESGPWHYINVPISLPDNTSIDRHDPNRNHILAKMDDFERTLCSSNKAPELRARALIFFIHLAGDLHMPLHVGDNDDKGGNATQVLYRHTGMQRELQTNMHALWDWGMIESEPGAFADRFSKVKNLVTDKSALGWQRGEPVDWAQESFVLAKIAYINPITNRLAKNGDRMGDEYRAKFLGKAHERMAQAGVRLADRLNKCFYKKLTR